MLSVCLSQGAVILRDEPRPRRRPGSALIRLLYGGICNTDLELQRGYYDFRGVPGHEFVGEVVAADDQKWVSQRVVGEINLACGRCEWCAQGLGRHCPKRRVLGIVKQPGAFREFLTLPESNLHAVPREIPSEHAVFIEPLAAACEILDQVHISRGEPVAVLGDGKLGLLIAQVLKGHGAEVHQYGKHKEKLKLASQMGIETRIVQKLPAGKYHWVVDATGASMGLYEAVKIARPRGTVIMKSTVHGRVGIDSAPIVVNEITLIGSRCGRFEPALRMLRSGTVRVGPLISEVFPLNRARDAFKRAAARGTLKVLLHA